MPNDNWMPIGTVAGPFGIHGEVKIDPLTDFPERFDGLREVHLGPEHRSFAVENCRHHNRHVLLKLAGIDTPEQVDPLRELDLEIPRDQAVALPEGHYFLDQLIGMAVLAEDGEGLGTISEVLRTGSNDVYVVGKGSSAQLIPGIADAIAELDLAAGRLIVRRWVLDTGG